VKRYGVITILAALYGILITLAVPNIPAGAQTQPVIRFDPSALELRPDTPGAVNVRVDDVQNLYGLEIQLAFDPDIIEVIDADPEAEGVQIKPAGWWKDGFVAVNQVDNGSGRIDFAATLLRPAQAVSGNQVVATVAFVIGKTGTSMLRVESAILSTRNAETIAYTQQAGEIGVNESGQAPNVQANTRPAGPAPGRLALAGAAVLALFTALGGFIYVLRKR
jgi:hypothetical protein